MHEKIENISDTALWVATYRALESERPDALFKDPLAAVLTGERGREIARDIGLSEMMSWVMVTRTMAIDRLLLKAIEMGAHTVLNLGAGLDTRPYRMKLPSDLRWIEVDFKNIIDLKNQKLSNETPVCRLERVALDLSNRAIRQQYFAQVARGSEKVLVITEGVLPYLSNEEASQLAEDLHATSAFAFWIHDFYEGDLKKQMPKSRARKLQATPFKINIHGWFDFFSIRGWDLCEKITALDEGRRIGRAFPIPMAAFLFRFLPSKTKEKLKNTRGYALLKRN